MIRRDDTSPLPAAAREPDHHQHPLPLYVRLALVGFAVGLALALGGLFALYLEGRHEAQLRAQRVAASVEAELDRRGALRDEQNAATNARITQQQARTRQVVCALVRDLPPTASTRAALIEFRCP